MQAHKFLKFCPSKIVYPGSETK